MREDHDREATERRRQLLDAARVVFERKGYGLATIADITEQAGTSRATFYVYFASKKNAFLVLAERVRADFLAAQDTSGLGDDVRRVIDRTVGGYLDATVSNLALITLLDHQAIGDEDVKNIWGEIRNRTIGRTARYLRDAADQGIVKLHADPMTIARMGVGIIQIFAPSVLDGRIPREDAIAEITGLFHQLTGLDSGR